MKALWSPALGAALAIAGCVVQPKPIVAEVIELPPRTCERWFAFAEDVPPDVRAVAREAAYSWAGFTRGRVRIAFGDEGRDQFYVVRDATNRSTTIDYLYGGLDNLPLGITTTIDDGSVEGRAKVEILVDRIPKPKRWSVIAHELGHACGMFDLDEEGNVMSGKAMRFAPALRSFGQADAAEARRRGF